MWHSSGSSVSVVFRVSELWLELRHHERTVNVLNPWSSLCVAHNNCVSSESSEPRPTDRSLLWMPGTSQPQNTWIQPHDKNGFYCKIKVSVCVFRSLAALCALWPVTWILLCVLVLPPYWRSDERSWRWVRVSSALGDMPYEKSCNQQAGSGEGCGNTDALDCWWATVNQSLSCSALLPVNLMGFHLVALRPGRELFTGAALVSPELKHLFSLNWNCQRKTIQLSVSFRS